MAGSIRLHERAKSALGRNEPLAALLALCIIRLWLMPLPSSFWVDEMATVFVVRHGAADPSLAVALQVPASLYYWLPRLADRLFGISEIGYRLPSVLAMGVALWLVARLAGRLIHPSAGWFAAIACLGVHDINYHAADARPYALGMCMAAAAVWYLVRWLDTAGWREGLLFVLFAALVWRVHLIYWPFYAVLPLYALARLLGRETRVRPGWAALVFGSLALALLPVLPQALNLLREAHSHVIVALPTVKQWTSSLQMRLILICGICALVLNLIFRWQREREGISGSSLLLVAAWWLCQPVGLFLFSHATGESVFVSRYLSLSLPAVALGAASAASFFLPGANWRPAALALAAGVLLMKGHWSQAWPVHDNSNWRDAARAINQATTGPETPVICPSPFIEAQWPVWRPDYPLPGFLYAHLPVYPLRGRAYLFPLIMSPEAEQYADTLSRTVLPGAGRFMLYGGRFTIRPWRKWFAARRELADWTSRSLGEFGDVDAVIFVRRPASGAP